MRMSKSTMGRLQLLCTILVVLADLVHGRGWTKPPMERPDGIRPTGSPDSGTGSPDYGTGSPVVRCNKWMNDRPWMDRETVDCGEEGCAAFLLINGTTASHSTTDRPVVPRSMGVVCLRDILDNVDPLTFKGCGRVSRWVDARGSVWEEGHVCCCERDNCNSREFLDGCVHDEGEGPKPTTSGNSMAQRLNSLEREVNALHRKTRYMMTSYLRFTRHSMHLMSRIAHGLHNRTQAIYREIEAAERRAYGADARQWEEITVEMRRQRERMEERMESLQRYIDNLLVGPSPQPSSRPQPNPRTTATPQRDVRYFLLRHRSTWREAREDCRREGAHLASVTSQYENSQILRLLEEKSRLVGRVNAGEAWIGYSDTEREGRFTWTGTPTENHHFTNWQAGEPNNDANGGRFGEDCTTLVFYHSWSDTHWHGRWNDVSCTARYYPVCELVNGATPRPHPIHTTPQPWRPETTRSSVSNCGGDLEENNLRVQKYPGLYRNRQNCRWTIRRTYPFVVRFVSFSVEHCTRCGCDYVTVGDDNKLCGYGLPSPVYRYDGGVVTVVFRTDRTVRRDGFQLVVETLDPSPTGQTPEPTRWRPQPTTGNNIGSTVSPDHCRSRNRFMCENKRHCVPLGWLCDGDNDCGDMSDEQPTTCALHTTPSGPRPTGWRPQPTGWRPQPTGWRPQPTGWRPRPTGWRPRPTGWRPQPTGWRPRPTGWRPQPTGWRPRPTGWRPQPTGWRPQPTGWRPRPTGWRPQPTGWRPQPTGWRPQPTGWRPQPTGWRPRPTGWRPQPTGWRPQPTGWRPRPTGWRPQPTGWRPRPTSNNLGSTVSPDHCRSRNRFMCENRRHCVPLGWLCDGDNDCGDMSDEQPTTCALHTTPSGPHPTGSGSGPYPTGSGYQTPARGLQCAKDMGDERRQRTVSCGDGPGAACAVVRMFSGTLKIDLPDGTVYNDSTSYHEVTTCRNEVERAFNGSASFNGCGSVSRDVQVKGWIFEEVRVCCCHNNHCNDRQFMEGCNPAGAPPPQQPRTTSGPWKKREIDIELEDPFFL